MPTRPLHTFDRAVRSHLLPSRITPLAILTATALAMGCAKQTGQAQRATPETVTKAAKNAQKAKNAEANEMLERLKRSAKRYYTNPRVDENGLPATCAFPVSAPLTPAGKSCCDPKLDRDGDNRCDAAPAAWKHPAWSALGTFGRGGFAMTDQHYFQYKFESSGTLKDARYTITAQADLDCDGVLSTFRVQGTGDPNATKDECNIVNVSEIFRVKGTE